MSAIIPIPRISISIRPGTMDDVPFLDSLQKMHTKQVGWMPTAQFGGKIKAGHVLIAEENAARIGYLIGNDQYFKRDDVGIIYQINIAEGKRRSLVGAELLKMQFERSAYGCKLYCCWCAQDIEANHFWESMGFVPLAFRAGSEKKQRIHIFWSKRIREGDTTTPWWFPSQTTGGSIREDRIVLPIPPGTHWSDAKPMVLPGQGQARALADSKARRAGGETPKLRTPTSMRKQFVRPSANPQPEPVAKKVKPKKQKQKNDPQLVAAARELRDRWLEHANAHPEALESRGKYDVSRMIEDRSSILDPQSSPALLPTA